MNIKAPKLLTVSGLCLDDAEGVLRINRAAVVGGFG